MNQHAPFCEFLLKLASDPEALEQYQDADNSNRQMLMSFEGVTDATQQAAILQKNTDEIAKLICAELGNVCAEPHVFHGNHIHIQMNIQFDKSDPPGNG